MIIPYFSAKRIKSDWRLSEFWHEPARDMDCALSLDREIMNAYPQDSIFVQALMKDEPESEWRGGTRVKGNDPMTDAEIKKTIARASMCNARCVLVVDRRYGLRIKDYVFVFAFPETTEVEIEDKWLRVLEAKRREWSLMLVQEKK